MPSHESWNSLVFGPPLEEVADYQRRGFRPLASVCLDRANVRVKWNDEPIEADPQLEVGSYDWVKDLCQRIVDSGPNGMELVYIQDVGIVGDDGSARSVADEALLAETPDSFTFLVRGNY